MTPAKDPLSVDHDHTTGRIRGLLKLTDLDLGPQRITAVTYRQQQDHVGVSVQVGDEFNLVRTLKEADRPRRRKRKKRKKRR